jgi:shikimate dehydrogenase
MRADAPQPRPRCGVLGSPISHSLSPTLHRAAYSALGLGWDYVAQDVDQARLPGFIAALTPRWRGLSVTMPLKREVIAYCDRVEDLGAMLSSINTVVIDSAGTRSGYNTDVVGFTRALAAAGVSRIGNVVIVGGGATAASALAAVAQLGAHTATIVARSPDRASGLVELESALGLAISVQPLSAIGAIQPADLVVSTVPADGQDAFVGAAAKLAPIVFDVIYHPARTPLVEHAELTGATVVRGFELLLHQAARQVELMTGARVAPVAEMRAAGLAALGNR